MFDVFAVVFVRSTFANPWVFLKGATYNGYAEAEMQKTERTMLEVTTKWWSEIHKIP